MTNEQKINLFQDVLDKMETEELPLYLKDMLVLIPEDSIICSSSSTGKYHNANQCKIFGNLYHSLMVFEIGNYLVGLEQNQEILDTPEKRDCVRIALILHDAIKYGWNHASFTQFTHPLISAEFVRSTSVAHDIDQTLKDYIADMIASHSGQWTTSKRSKEELPKPETFEQKLVHTCDYLSSRNNIDMTYSEQLQDTIDEIIEDMIDSYTMTFGKYKDQTVKKAFETNPQYFTWLEENGGIKEPIKTIISKL